MIVAHNQGFGDHIICNGLIRTLAEKHDVVKVMCAKPSPTLVQYMYRDNPKIEVVPTKDEALFMDNLRQGDEEYMILGHESFTESFKNGQIHFDEGFYHFADIDFDNRFDKFHVERDFEEEERIFIEQTKGNEEYIFLHDDPERGFSIDRNRVRDDLYIVENDPNINFFNYRKLFEKATELHLMQSGIFDFTNSIPLPDTEIFVHTYVRKYSQWYWTEGINGRTVVE